MADIPQSEYSRDPAEILAERQSKSCKGCIYADHSGFMFRGEHRAATFCGLQSKIPPLKAMRGDGVRCDDFTEKAKR